MKKILLCFDNSETSLVASEVALRLAKTFGSEIVGIHGYNAAMHEGAFKSMEPFLPSRYQKEETLQKQREVHNDLIHTGMEQISLSCLKSLNGSFHRAGIHFKTVVREGKNFKALQEILSSEGGDLVVVGSSGFNCNGNGFLGSVCLRLLRGNDKDFLIIKKDVNHTQPTGVVCLDGSSTALHALRAAKRFVEQCDATLHLLYVFDSSLHRNLFGRLKESVMDGEHFSFNSKEQERLHDEFIDKGLATVGKMILDEAEREVFSTGPEYMKKILDGPIYRRICDYASEVEADLLFVGRTGRHFTEGIDIGSVAENVVRYAPCSVWVAGSKR
ncbi:MAG: universal stress protein [Thermodesulfobacteriota bacterium]|nr:universal stress protein [Thermodesulfobacteriota bacterium]